jgi:hypothetical protein
MNIAIFIQLTSETAKENNDDMQVGKEFDSDYKKIKNLVIDLTR